MAVPALRQPEVPPVQIPLDIDGEPKLPIIKILDPKTRGAFEEHSARQGLPSRVYEICAGEEVTVLRILGWTNKSDAPLNLRGGIETISEPEKVAKIIAAIRGASQRKRL